MNEALVTRAQANIFFGALFVAGLILGPAAFAMARRRGGNGVAAAALYGGPLVLAGLLWPIYNAITDHIGLDRVANLAVNLVLFVGVGAACGLGWRRIAGRR